MSSDESDSILPNLQKTRELWSQKSDGSSADHIMPKTPTSSAKLPTPVAETNGENAEEYVVRFEDKIDDNYEMPDVKSMKSQWENTGPVPVPQMPKSNTVTRKQTSQDKQPAPESVPVNREPQEEEEYEVKLGALKDKFEREAKAANARVVWDNSARETVSKAAVDQKKNLKKEHATSIKRKSSPTSSPKSDASSERFESEIEAQRHYHSANAGLVEMPTVELGSLKQQFEQRKDEKLVIPMSRNSSNHKKQRQTSISSDASSQATDIVRHDDPLTQEVKFEVEVNSLRQRFEQASQVRTAQKPMPVRGRKMSDQTDGRQRAVSEHNSTEIIRSSDPSNEEMVSGETVKERLARYKALTGVSSARTARKPTPKKRNVVDVHIDSKHEEVEDSENQDQSIVRSPPAGTKEKPDYKASIDLEQARQIFESNTSPTRSGRSSRSSSASFRRRSPRSRSTPSPIHRGTLSTSSSKSPSPVRSSSRNSISSRSSSPRSKSPKKFGDPDIVVLEHAEVNYYYEDNGTRLNSKSQSVSENENTSEDMSNAEVIKPPPAGTKEEADYVPSVDIRSVRSMFERGKETEVTPKGREPPPKKPVEIKKVDPASDALDSSSEQKPEVIRSTAAGSREEPEYQPSIDLKSARSLFESPHKVENYVPRNKIKIREEEAKRQRAAAAAASPRSSESSEASSIDVVKSSDAGSKENPEYQVDLKATKKLFEGGRAPDPIKRETSTNKPKRSEVAADVVRPEPAGTKEVVQFEKSTDLLMAKKKFENVDQQDAVEESKRKEPIDMQEEKRSVIQKEEKNKQETQQSPEEVDVQRATDDSVRDPAEALVEDSKDSSVHVTPERQHSVSSEELEEKSGVEEEAQERLQYIVSQEQQTMEHDIEQTEADSAVDTSADVMEEESDKVLKSGENSSDKEESKDEGNEGVNEPQEPPAAAVVPVRVAIPEDLTDKQDTDVAQEYGSYTNVISYNEEVQHHPSSSDSESDNETGDNKENVLANDDATVNGYGDGETKLPADANHVEDMQPSVKGTPDDFDATQTQQEIPGKTSPKPENILGDFEQPRSMLPQVDPFGLGDIVGPPQLPSEQNQNDPFGISMSLFSTPTPPPRGNKKAEIDLAKSEESISSSSDDDDDADKPHFSYPYDDDGAIQKDSKVAPASNGIDLFGASDIGNPVSPNLAPVQNSTGDLLGGFDPFTIPSNGNSTADIVQKVLPTQPVATNSADPFDLFAAPVSQEPVSSGAKDPFDLFA